MECATYPMVEPKRNRRLWTQCGTQYVGQCIGIDTARIQMDNAKEGKREDLRREDTLARIIHERCRETFETEG